MRGGAGSFRDYVLDQLADLTPVASRAMFGGHGLYHGETFFGIIFGDRLYFRTDEATRAEYVARGMKPFRPRAGAKLGRYYEVPLDIVEDSRALVRWAEQAARAGAGG
jgi:DNA transformation protein